MGFLDSLSALLTPTANAVGGYMQGRQQAQQQSFQDQLKAMQMQHQQAMDDQTRQINQARLKQYQTEDQLRQQKLQADQNAWLEGQREFPDAPDFQGAFTPGMTGIVELLRAKRAEKAATAKEQRANRAAFDVGHMAYPKDPTFQVYNPEYTGYAGYGKDLASREGQSAMWDRMQAQIADRDRLAAERAAKPPAGSWVQMVDADGKATPVFVNPSTHEQWSPPGVAYKPPAQSTRNVPPGAVKEIAAYDTIKDQAQSMLDNLKAATENKVDVTGRIGGIIPEPNWVMNLMNKGGETGKRVRADIQNLYATITKERAGTAVSKQELDLLESYLPNVNESEENAILKAEEFVKTITSQREAKLNTYQQFYPQMRPGDTQTPAAPPAPTRTPAAPVRKTPSVPLATRVQQLKAQGLSKEAARQTLVNEGYNLAGAP